MNPELIKLLRKLPLNAETASKVMPLIARYGLAGALVLARGYLGPLADRANDHPGGSDGGKSGETAVLGLALAKLVFELGELALHNPTLDPKGCQPEFKLDEAGRPPAMSVAHVLAAVRLWQQHAARRDAEAEAAAPRPTPRAQLQAARSQRYAVTPRYSYVAPLATYRAPR